MTNDGPKYFSGVDLANGSSKTVVAAGRIHKGHFELISFDWVSVDQLVTPHPVGSCQCHYCRGTGEEVLFQVPRECPTCEGTGWLGGKARVATARVQVKKPAEHITLHLTPEKKNEH